MKSIEHAEGMPVPPQIEDGAVVYNRIMAAIEPDLLTDQFQSLTGKYAGETPEQAEARAERYQKALEEYDRQYAAYKASKEQEVRAYERGVVQSVEHEARQQDDASITTLESAMNSL